MGCTIKFGEETVMKVRFNLGLYGSLCMWSMWYGNMEPPLTQPTEFFVIIEEGLFDMGIKHCLERNGVSYSAPQLTEVINTFKTTGKLL